MSYPTSGYHGADPTVLQKEGASLAYQAVQHDQAQRFDLAIFYYTEAAQTLLAAAQAGSQVPNIGEKAKEYMMRADTIRQALQSNAHGQPEQPKIPQQHDVERAHFLLREALHEDEQNNTEDAISLYSEAITLCLKVPVIKEVWKDLSSSGLLMLAVNYGALTAAAHALLSIFIPQQQYSRDSVPDPKLKERVVKMATQALDRAEALKKKTAKMLPPHSTSSAASSPGSTIRTITGKVVPPLGFGAFSEGDEDNSSTQKLLSSGTTGVRFDGKTHEPTGKKALINVGPNSYSKDEIAVLRNTSKINGREYVPFLAVDKKEKFAFLEPFNDRDGKLILSPKQKQQFGKWVRPEDFCDEPRIIYAVSSFSIRQTIVSDCSFVASLAISAQYEKRFRKKLITNIIYPQNQNGEPVFNPCGKYMVKFNLNGMWRKIIIDDYLPMSKYGDLLCSFSNNKNELWVSLLEKAYMKVMGGYDFPGSNSNIDLHALTEWIPERIAIRPGSVEFNKDKEFKRLLDRYHKGHCLVTVATGELSEAEADRAGLVPTHAYAMLDIREYKGHKLFMLKNPWNHLRWKGNYSEKDSSNWTPDLQKALNYDPDSAQMFDNGVFWIDYDSLCKFFDVFYINWDPELFMYTTCIQHTWSAKEGPKKDSYNISDNPQYRLEVTGNQSGAALWILLTRHITDKADFADNKEFITVLVYKNGGKKVFYPYDPPPYKDGVRINSPHYLCKLVEESSRDPYTLVISQYEKNNTTHYTLRVYSTCEFSLTRFPDPYKKQLDQRITGQWKGKTSGGCANNRESYTNNPLYQVHIENNNIDNHLMIELLGPKQYSVGFEVICVSENVGNAPGAIKKVTSGDFRPGYCVLQLANISGGVYNVRPCTFKAGNEGPFFLDFSCSAPYAVSQIQ